MLQLERQQKILDYLKENRKATTNELSELLGVSTTTIRTDLNQMDKEKLLTKTHGIQPCIITASGDSGHSTKCFYGHGVMTLLHGIVDYFKNTGRIVHEQCTYFLVVLIEEIFFKNSISCFR